MIYMSNALFKVPLLASATWNIHLCMSPPNAPPGADEQLAPAGFEKLAPKAVPTTLKVGGHLTSHAAFWALGLTEIVVLVANHLFPEHPLSQRVLTLLCPTFVPNSLRITSPFLVGWLLNTSGTLLRLRCYQILNKMFTFELAIRKDHQLVTNGPYSIVRHPSYTGGILAGIGTLVCHGSAGSWLMECAGVMTNARRIAVAGVGCFIAILALRSRIRKEEGLLRQAFGKEWDAYCSRVTYRLLPFVY